MEAMYELESTLYEGRTSVVHRGTHRRTGDEVAVKTYSRSGGVDTSIEIQILSSLQPHPNICAVREVNRAPGAETKLIMDYYQSFLPKQGRMTPSDVRHIAVQVLNALSFMHEKQMAHLGLQPKNIMCRSRDSSVKLIHFKRACYLDSKQKLRISPDTGPGLRYDAPEILVGDICTPAADIWSFGCVIGEMIAGKPLFSGSNPAMVLSSIVNAVGMPTARLVSEMKGKPEFRAVLTDLKARPPANGSDDSPLKMRFQELLQDDYPLLRALISCLSIDPSVRPTMRELMHHQAFNVSVKPSPQLYMVMPGSPRRDDMPPAPVTPGVQEGDEMSPTGGQYPQGAAGLLGRRVSQVRRGDSRGRVPGDQSGSGSDMENGMRQSVNGSVNGGTQGRNGRFSENGANGQNNQNLSSWRMGVAGGQDQGMQQVPGGGVGPPSFTRDRQMSYLQRNSQGGGTGVPQQLKLDVAASGMMPMPPQPMPPNGKPLLTHNRSVRVSEPGIRPPPGAIPEPLPQAYYAEGYQQQRGAPPGKQPPPGQGPDRRLLFVEYGGRVSSAAPPGYGMVDQYGQPIYPPNMYPPGQMPPGMAPGQMWPGYPQPGMPGYPGPEGGSGAPPSADAVAPTTEQDDGTNTALSSPRAGTNDYSEFSAEKEAMLHEVAVAAVQKAALGAALRAAQNRPGDDDLAIVVEAPTHFLSVTFMPKVAHHEEGEEDADASQDVTPDGFKSFAEGAMVQAKSYTNQSENQDDLLSTPLLSHLYLTPESTITQAMSNLIGLKNISELSIATDEDEGAPQYAILQGLEHMTRLQIHCLGVKNQASHINMLSISCCTQITRLELEDYCLSSSNSIKLLVSMPKLRYLGVRQLEPDQDVFLQKPCTLTELFVHQMPTSDQLLKLPLASVTELKTADFKWRLGVGGTPAAVGAAAQQIQQATNMLGPRLVSNTYDPVWDKHHVSPFLIWDEMPTAPAANVIAALNPLASKLRELRLQKWLVDEELVHAMVVAGPNLELLKVDRCNVTSKAWAALVSLVHLKHIEMLSEVKVSDLIAYAVAAAHPAAIKICETRISHIELQSCVDMIRGCREAYNREAAVIVRHKYW